MARLRQAELVAGRYRVERLLGRGGMSDVWLTRDERLGREVALKFMQPGPALAGVDSEREAGIVAGLRHPNIVTVYDAGEEDGRRYIVMERVDGVSLRERLQEAGAMAPGEAARLGAAIAGALSYAHARGVLHNDVKPENILIDADGTPRLTDFGAATVTGATLDTEGAAQLMGTIVYVAPEVLQGMPPSGASDVYGLATTLFEAMAGRLPFDGRSSAAIAGQKLSHAPTRLREALPGAPAELDRIMAAALSPGAGDRPDAGAFERSLRAGGQATTLPAAPPVAAASGSGPRATQPLAMAGAGRRGGGGRRGLLVLAGLSGAGLVLAGAVALTSGGDPRETDEEPGSEMDVALSAATPTATETASPTQKSDDKPNGNGNGNDDDDEDDEDDDKRKPNSNSGRGRGR